MLSMSPGVENSGVAKWHIRLHRIVILRCCDFQRSSLANSAHSSRQPSGEARLGASGRPPCQIKALATDKLPSMWRRSEYPSYDFIGTFIEAATMTEHNSLRLP